MEWVGRVDWEVEARGERKEEGRETGGLDRGVAEELEVVDERLLLLNGLASSTLGRPTPPSTLAPTLLPRLGLLPPLKNDPKPAVNRRFPAKDRGSGGGRGGELRVGVVANAEAEAASIEEGGGGWELLRREWGAWPDMGRRG